MNTQEWIDRYVAEVGRMLPERKRADVEREIRSLLQDAIEDEIDGAPAGDEQILTVLRQFGPPREMAMRYGASQYLIGPLLYPTFIIVLRVVIGIVLAVGLLGVVLSLSQATSGLDLGEIVGGLVSGVVQAAGWVVLIFALLERLNLREFELVHQTWDPRTLPAAGNVDRVSVFETIITVVFGTAFIVLLSVNLDSLGRIAVPGSDWTSPEIFSAEFVQYIPWLIALLVADIVLAVATLIRGRWTPVLRVLGIAVNLFGIVLSWLMLTGPTLAAWEILDPAFRIIVAIVLVANAIELAQQVWRLRRSRALGGSAGAKLTVL